MSVPLKVTLALIHNHNQTRNEAANKTLSDLVSASQTDFAFTQLDVSYQPPLRRLPILFFLMRDFYAVRHKRIWQRYRKITPRHLLLDLHGFMRGMIKHFINSDSHHRARRQLTGAIEVALVHKHIRAWQLFLDGSDDTLVCCEDDVIGAPDSTARFCELARMIQNETSDVPFFADLAGGLPQEAIKMEPFLISSEEGIRTLTEPATNTTCSYMINRAMAQHLCRLLAENPLPRLCLGADLMLDALFVLMDKAGIKSICFHAHPPIFIHGTAQGVYRSGIR